VSRFDYFIAIWLGPRRNSREVGGICTDTHIRGQGQRVRAVTRDRGRYSEIYHPK